MMTKNIKGIPRSPRHGVPVQPSTPPKKVRGGYTAAIGEKPLTPTTSSGVPTSIAGLVNAPARIYDRFSKEITIGEWSSMIEEAEEEIIFASTKMSRILAQAFVARDTSGTLAQMTLDAMLLNKALNGVDVTILFYHPDNVTLRNLKRQKNDLDELRQDLKRSFDIWSTQRLTFETIARRSATHGSFRVIQVREGHIPFRVTLTERRLLATLRLHTEIYNSGLSIDAYNLVTNLDLGNISVYAQIKKELSYLIEENSELTEIAYMEWERTKRQSG